MIQKFPQFSVLISVYHKDDPIHLTESLNSIIYNQSIPPSQIVLIVDGQIDSPLTIAIEYFKKKCSLIEVFSYAKNRGLGYALNFGLQFCRHEYIFRADADDICFYNRFELQLSKLLSDPNIGVLGSSIEEFNSIPGDLSRFRHTPISHQQIKSSICLRNPFNHMTVVFRKDHVQRVGGYIDVPGYEDYYLWHRLLNITKGANLSMPLVYARVGNGLINRRHGFKMLKNELLFQILLWRNLHISFTYLIRNILIRAFIRLLPIPILSFTYKKILRNKH